MNFLILLFHFILLKPFHWILFHYQCMDGILWKGLEWIDILWPHILRVVMWVFLLKFSHIKSNLSSFSLKKFLNLKLINKKYFLPREFYLFICELAYLQLGYVTVSRVYISVQKKKPYKYERIEHYQTFGLDKDAITEGLHFVRTNWKQEWYSINFNRE